MATGRHDYHGHHDHYGHHGHHGNHGHHGHQVLTTGLWLQVPMISLVVVLLYLVLFQYIDILISNNGSIYRHRVSIAPRYEMSNCLFEAAFENILEQCK